jgi:hypothetical protein
VEDQERVSGNLLLFTIKFSTEDRRGTNTARIYVIQSGTPVPVSDWMVVPMLMPEG